MHNVAMCKRLLDARAAIVNMLIIRSVAIGEDAWIHDVMTIACMQHRCVQLQFVCVCGCVTTSVCVERRALTMIDESVNTWGTTYVAMHTKIRVCRCAQIDDGVCMCVCVCVCVCVCAVTVCDSNDA